MDVFMDDETKSKPYLGEEIRITDFTDGIQDCTDGIQDCTL
jgi:hypothetical protein